MTRRANGRFVDRKHLGFTLVESLVALVVLSVGLLGIAALFLDSLRASRSALWRSQAVDLAADMADRIRANREGGASYEITLAAADNGATCNASGAFTDAAVAAQNDVACWLGEVATTLPGGDISITHDPESAAPVTPESYRILVQWVEPGNVTGSFALRVERSTEGNT